VPAPLRAGPPRWSDDRMRWMVVVGVVLVVAGAVCVYLAVRARRRVHAMTAAETLTVAELEARRGIAAGLGAEFTQVCEVVGQAAPGAAGLLTAELSGTACVWHRSRVERRYETRERDGDGDERVTTRTETVAQQASAAPLAVVRDGAVIALELGGQVPDGAEQVVDRFEESRRGLFSTDTTLGYRYTEWVLRPGTPLYVLGEVRDGTGALVMGPPRERGQHFVVSTRSEEELTARGRRSQVLLSRIGAGVAVAGVVLAALAPVL
jgi:hypothetical protein